MMLFVLFQLFCCPKDKGTSLVYITYVVVISPLNALRQLDNAGGTIVFKDQTWASLHVWNYSIVHVLPIKIYVIHFVT